MTEALPNTSAEQNKPSDETEQHVGYAAVTSAGYERTEEVSIADLVDTQNTRLHRDFEAFLQENPASPNDQLSMPRIIHGFVSSKATELFDKHPKSPILANAQKPLPTALVIANLRHSRHERLKERPSQRRAHLSRERYVYNPIAMLNADTYPEVHFISQLREEFLARDDHKKAMITTELLIATGRTINALMKNHPEQSPEETSPEN